MDFLSLPVCPLHRILVIHPCMVDRDLQSDVCIVGTTVGWMIQECWRSKDALYGDSVEQSAAKAPFFLPTHLIFPPMCERDYAYCLRPFLKRTFLQRNHQYWNTYVIEGEGGGKGAHVRSERSSPATESGRLLTFSSNSYGKIIRQLPAMSFFRPATTSSAALTFSPCIYSASRPIQRCRCLSTTSIALSGHNRWSKIRHRKGAADQQRSALFAKLGKVRVHRFKNTVL